MFGKRKNKKKMLKFVTERVLILFYDFWVTELINFTDKTNTRDRNTLK